MSNPFRIYTLLSNIQMNKFSPIYQQDISQYSTTKVIPTRIAQLVKANTGKCGPNKWHIVLGSNSVTDDTLNLLNVGCCGMINTLRFRSLWRVPRVWP